MKNSIQQEINQGIIEFIIESEEYDREMQAEMAACFQAEMDYYDMGTNISPEFKAAIARAYEAQKA